MLRAGGLSFEFAQAVDDVRRHAMQLFGRGCDGCRVRPPRRRIRVEEFHIILFKVSDLLIIDYF